MKKILISLLVATVLFTIFIYFFFFRMYPQSTIDLGFIRFISSAPEGLIGGFIGMFVASYFSFTPSIMAIPEKLSTIKGNFKLSTQPIKTEGRIIGKNVTAESTELSIHYDGNRKVFNVNNKAIHGSIKVGDDITVYYDPNNTELPYLDFFKSLDEEIQTIQDSDVLFKLIDITPRFDMGNNIFELLGEFHGGQYQGKKGSLIHEFPREDIAQYTPGRLFPCVISGTKDNYSIQLLTSS